MKIFLLVFSILISGIYAIDNLQPAYFEVILDRIEVLYEKPGISEWHLKIGRANKTKIITGYVILGYPLGNDIQMETKLMKKQGGEYRYLPYGTPPTPYCDICTNDVYVYPEVAKYSDFPEDIRNNCPIVPGNYSFYGTQVNLEQFPKVALSSGEYAGEIQLHLNSEVVSIYRVYAFINNI